MYIAVPALVLFVVIGLWWALFSPQTEESAEASITPTRPVGAVGQPTQSPTEQATLPAYAPTGTTSLPTLPPATTEAVTTEAESPETLEAAAEETAAPREPLAVGDTALVCCTDGAGLRMRSGAGTGHPVVKMLAEDKVVEVIGGPEESTGYTWWQIRDDVGTSGWAAEDFLTKQ